MCTGNWGETTRPGNQAESPAICQALGLAERWSVCITKSPTKCWPASIGKPGLDAGHFVVVATGMLSVLCQGNGMLASAYARQNGPTLLGMPQTCPAFMPCTPNNIPA